MADPAIARQSALTSPGDGNHVAAPLGPGLSIEEIPGLVLTQIVVWPDARRAVDRRLAERFGGAPSGRRWFSLEAGGQAVLRLDPLRYWLVGASGFDLDPEEGATLELSHSRTRVRITGENARTLLNRCIPLDLRDTRFADGSVASTVMHGAGITLWRRSGSFEVFLPRSFAQSLFEIFQHNAVG